MDGKYLFSRTSFPFLRDKFSLLCLHPTRRIVYCLKLVLRVLSTIMLNIRIAKNKISCVIPSFLALEKFAYETS